MKLHLEVYEVFLKTENSNWQFIGICNNAYSVKALAKIYAKLKKIENYDYKYNSKNKIISFRKNDELLYRFNFNRNGLIKKATNVPEELVDVYKYNKNGDLINGNGDIYSYKYDQYGNWIYYRIDYKKRDVPHVKTREIEYY